MQVVSSVTICVPTINRPNGLRCALESIAKQSYHAAEVIVSDNASHGYANEAIVAEFFNRIPGLRFVKQPVNIGPYNNFYWLLNQVRTPYFMWLADDDELGDADYVRNLSSAMGEREDLLLVFPDVSVFFDSAREHWMHHAHQRVFAECETDWEYLRAFCGYGGGHCFYGLWNRRALLQLGFENLLDQDLSYYNEGRFLHTVFINGGARFEPKATLIYDGTSPNRKTNRSLYHSFRQYSYRVHRLYLTSQISLTRKVVLWMTLAKSHYPYLIALWRRRNE
jgi:glycosyltransferase involved in cell wall biosynthesis